VFEIADFCTNSGQIIDIDDLLDLSATSAMATTRTSSMTSAPSQMLSLTAGMIAGAVEGAVTYPAEFVKTKAQFGGSKAEVSGKS
jgi:hypothetical protein